MDHIRIYLQPADCHDPEVGRLWCDTPIDCDDPDCTNGNPISTEYISSEFILKIAKIEMERWEGDNQQIAHEAIKSFLTALCPD